MSNDATTWDKIGLPDQNSPCVNCGLEGTKHIDGKCLFEASNFEASQFRLPFKAAPHPTSSDSVTVSRQVWFWTSKG